MRIEALIKAKFLKRYKRFFIDGELSSGEVVVGHCPNTGSMKSLLDEAEEVWLRYDNNPKRKLKYTAEFLKLKSGAIALINTQRPNALVEEYLLGWDPQGNQAHLLKETQPQLADLFSSVSTWKREVKYGQENSKIDLWGQTKSEQEVYLEVKNMTLMDSPQWGSFPDAVTVRGQKHLRELTQLVEQPCTIPVLCFLASRNDIENYGVASHIDPHYAELFEEARQAGVAVWVPRLQYQIEEDQDQVHVEMTLGSELNFQANPH